MKFADLLIHFTRQNKTQYAKRIFDILQSRPYKIWSFLSAPLILSTMLCIFTKTKHYSCFLIHSVFRNTLIIININDKKKLIKRIDTYYCFSNLCIKNIREYYGTLGSIYFQRCYECITIKRVYVNMVLNIQSK